MKKDEEILHDIYSQEKLHNYYKKPKLEKSPSEKNKIPFSVVKESLILKEFITVLKELN